MNKSDEYLNEVSTKTIISDLGRLKKRIDGLIRIYSVDMNSHIDNKSKDNLLSMCESSLGVISGEVDKILANQKRRIRNFYPILKLTI